MHASDQLTSTRFQDVKDDYRYNVGEVADAMELTKLESSGVVTAGTMVRVKGKAAEDAWIEWRYARANYFEKN
jgi:hypothetical protein